MRSSSVSFGRCVARSRRKFTRCRVRPRSPSPSRSVPLGVFYTSNVEQYLFEQKTYGAFVDSVRAMPRDDESLIVRVWFDAGKRHPALRAGLRTTQLAIPANLFLARAAKKPFHTYWDVVNQSAE